jgi:glycosyltransferase involved in cell wall biosynthesis
VTSTRPLRVLWLTKGLGPGGAERLLVEHAASGDRDAFEYEAAYLLSWKQHLVSELVPLGVRVHGLDVQSELDARWLVRLDRVVRAGRFDIVHIHSPSVAAGARPLLRARRNARRTAIVYTEHNRWPSYNPVTRLANLATYRLNDATIAVSDAVRDTVAPSLRSRVEVVRHGIDIQRVQSARVERIAVREELGVQPADVLAVTVANLRATKNYPALLAAAKHVVECDPSVRFVAVGQGPLEHEIRAEHAALALGDAFRLLGYRADVTRLVAAADLFVLASDHEGLPVSVMEALTLGVPVVATDVGGLREAVTDGCEGLLVEPGSPRALADAVLTVARDGELRSRLAKHAARAGARFSARVATARIEDLYRSVVRHDP